MAYNPDIHDRKSIRLKEYDYARAGAYFVTIVTQHNAHLFGKIVKGDMHLNNAGEMVLEYWQKLPGKFPSIRTDAFIIMPNHIHGIIHISPAVRAIRRGRPLTDFAAIADDISDDGKTAETDDSENETRDYFIELGQPRGAAPTRSNDSKPILGDVVGWFKTMTTNAYIRGVKNHGWMTFNKRVWHRNYFERVIRSDAELTNVRNYIHNNPLNWINDQENPHHV